MLNMKTGKKPIPKANILQRKNKTRNSAPLADHKAAFHRANNQLDRMTADIKEMSQNVIPGIEKQLKSAGAPWIEGQEITD
jgi:hypothetical protein